MKILYVDIDSPAGHKNYNYNLIKCLSQICTVDVAFQRGYLSSFENSSKFIHEVFKIPDIFYEIKTNKRQFKLINKIFHRIKFFSAMKWINRLVNKNNYNLVVFGGVDIISFCLSTIGLNKRFVFVDHAIANISSSIIKKSCWKYINKNAEVIVMEDYIKDYLLNDVKIKNKVWVVKHPLPKLNNPNFNNLDTNKKTIFAPSNSNDERFISFLIENNELLEGYKVIIKSKKYEYENENIKVFKNRITDEKYNMLMLECQYVLLPYNSNYNYRVSGVFFEAVSINKKCIISGNNTLRYYADKYPNSVMEFSNFNDFFDVISSNNSTDKSELALIKQEYSDENLISSIKRILLDEEIKNAE